MPFQKPSRIFPRKCLISRHRKRPLQPSQKQVILEMVKSASDDSLRRGAVNIAKMTSKVAASLASPLFMRIVIPVTWTAAKEL